MAKKISRAIYADMYGPTTGDKVRLADTELFIEVERDPTHYGEEVKFGGGKVIRDGMGQSQKGRADGAVDTVITNALIVDSTGIYKADIGLKDGVIGAIGKAGNPDTQPNVDIIIGPGTEAIAAEGHILTAGGFDSHIHLFVLNKLMALFIQSNNDVGWRWPARHALLYPGQLAYWRWQAAMDCNEFRVYGQRAPLYLCARKRCVVPSSSCEDWGTALFHRCYLGGRWADVQVVGPNEEAALSNP